MMCTRFKGGVLQVIRHYHGHLSGVYSLKLHPTLDVLMTGGRDSVCRVWDMRTKVQIHCLSGHDDTVCSILSQPTDPQVPYRRLPEPLSHSWQVLFAGECVGCINPLVQVITGSHDKTIKLWDIRAVRPTAITTLTYHKKSVRAMALHPTEYSFASGSADNIKKWVS